MKYYIVFNDKGHITHSGLCQDADFELQGPADRLIEVDDVYSYTQGHVVNGKFEPWPDEVIQRMMSPQPFKTWSAEAMDWV